MESVCGAMFCSFFKLKFCQTIFVSSTFLIRTSDLSGRLNFIVRPSTMLALERHNDNFAKVRYARKKHPGYTL